MHGSPRCACGGHIGTFTQGLQLKESVMQFSHTMTAQVGRKAGWEAGKAGAAATTVVATLPQRAAFSASFHQAGLT